MELQENHEEAELGLPTAVAATSYEEFGMPPNHDEQEPVVEVVPMWQVKVPRCLKNHAVSIVGHAIDGCIEFLPGGEEGTLDALKCAACNCHRNLHRKETHDTYSVPFHHHHHPLLPPPVPLAAYYRALPGYLHMTGHQCAMLAHPSLSGRGGPQPPWEDLEDSDPTSGATTHDGSGSSSKKRFRTKFTQHQKDKMLVFAEKLGWRMQKNDESIVQEFCSEIGVQRHLLKVWMHNNKHILGKKP
ncbi:zinc-finger homeodomain protein 2-like [Glycine soja]|uniref:zinc-finger homeodomain protein 2-like n=1 Tax=Glycine soja TaxID=3848 RepID=UPI00103D5942|nr:zinc-finger homeodomain protein 2-like [Glycine soja]